VLVLGGEVEEGSGGWLDGDGVGVVCELVWGEGNAGAGVVGEEVAFGVGGGEVVEEGIVGGVGEDEDGEEIGGHGEGVDAETEVVGADVVGVAGGGEGVGEGIVGVPGGVVVGFGGAEEFFLVFAGDGVPEVEVLEGRGVGGGLEDTDGGDVGKTTAMGDFFGVAPVEKEAGFVRGGVVADGKGADCEGGRAAVEVAGVADKGTEGEIFLEGGLVGGVLGCGSKLVGDGFGDIEAIEVVGVSEGEVEIVMRAGVDVEEPVDGAVFE